MALSHNALRKTSSCFPSNQANRLKSEYAKYRPSGSLLDQVEVMANDNYVALDCEMVGVGPLNISVLARVSIVNFEGEAIFDTCVKVEEKVTDYRTTVSGIRSPDLKSPNAMSYGECRSTVQKHIRGKILVGHGLSHDLQILNLYHPCHMIRDTSMYVPFMRQGHDGYWRPRRLKDLTKLFLRRIIQDGEHSSVEDAAAAISLYKLVRNDWDPLAPGI